MNDLIEKLYHYISPEEALEKIIRNINLVPRVEVVETYESCGRVLAEDVKSPYPIPKDNISHYDGYAVKSSDTLKASTVKPVRLKIVGRIDLTSNYNLSIGGGEAVYVVTGAKIPENSDAVIPVERVRILKDYIEIVRPVKYGENVTFRGSDVKEGEVILKKSHILRPQDLRFLLDIGKFKVKVYAKPRISLMGVGDELTNDANQSNYKKLETSTVMISSFLKEFNIDSTRVGVVQDSPRHILETVLSSLRNSDVVVTVGGVSLGVKDLCWTELSKHEGAIPIARGLRIQPGRATSIVVIDGKPVIMLPGLIQSTICGVYYILLPLVFYLQGLPMKNFLPEISAELSEEFFIREYISFKRIRFVKLLRDGDLFIAKPVQGDSSMIGTILKSDGFIEIPEGVERMERGVKVKVRLLSISQLLQLDL